MPAGRVNWSASVCAIVPVRGLATGKQRLAAIPSDAERHALCSAMLEDVLDTLASFSKVVVVTSDAPAASVARGRNVEVIPDRAEGLNASLESARETMRRGRGFSRLLFVPADLPGIAAADLNRHILASPETIIIAPGTDGGTNLLCCATEAHLPFAYGIDSARRHVVLAEQAGLSVRVIDMPAFALDIDNPCDLGLFSMRNIPSRTADLLARLDPRLTRAWAP